MYTPNTYADRPCREPAIECPHQGHNHTLNCRLPLLYPHTTHWTICPRTIHPDVISWNSIEKDDLL